MSSFTCPLFSLLKKTKKPVKYLGSWQLLRHSSSTLKRCHHSNWLLGLSQKHSPVWRQATHQCWLCGDTVCSGGHDSPPAPVVCVRSGHDCELGGASVLRAITPQQSSVSTYCPVKSLSDPYWLVGSEATGISSLNCSIKQKHVKANWHREGHFFRNSERFENNVWYVLENSKVLKYSLTKFCSLHWHF